MIQRIQTLFLLAAVVLQAIFSFSKLASYVLADFSVAFYTIGFKSSTEGMMLPTTPVFILSLAILALTTIAIFLYKKRMLQIRFCIYNMSLNVGMIALVFLNINNFLKNNVVEAQSFTPFIAIPVVNIILLYLAFRGIRKDELLVKAYDRLR